VHDPPQKSCPIQKQNSGMINAPETDVGPMKKSRFTEEQIFFALKQVELGMAVPEFCHKLWQVRTLSFIFPCQRPKDTE